VESEAWDDERALDAADQDQRSENLAPRSEHRATFIGENALLSNNTAIVGLVIDEWVDQRPSETQQAALAVNYDTPQAEPPNVTLLCTPAETSLRRWTEENAAAMVVETIAWMKIRALTSEDRVLPRSFMLDNNQVAYKDSKVARSRRIPVAKSRFLDTSWLDAPGQFKTVSNLSLTEAQKQGHERTGYRYSKE
jgi:hypothetical protein